MITRRGFLELPAGLPALMSGTDADKIEELERRQEILYKTIKSMLDLMQDMAERQEEIVKVGNSNTELFQKRLDALEARVFPSPKEDELYG